MKKVYVMLGIAAALTLSGCQMSPPKTAEPGPAQAIEETDEQEPDTIFIIGSIQTFSEDTVLFGDGSCYPGDPYEDKYLSQLEGSDVIVRDAKGEIIAKSTFHTDHVEDSCAWLFDVEVVPDSKFYSVDYLDFTTPVVGLDEAVDQVLEVDFVSAIAEQADKDHLEAWGIPRRPRS